MSHQTCKPSKRPTANANRNIAVSVCEIASASSTSRVDESAGIIYGVKVLGLESGNTGRTIGLLEEDFGDAVDRPYTYSLQAIRAAQRLYEGVGVYLDHPEFAFDSSGARRPIKKDRRTEDRFGWLENVRVQPDGLYADLHYFKSHKTSPLVVEAAQRRPEMLCLSHNAEAVPSLVNGRIVVTEIRSVRSVDLIGDRGGTTSSLFESETPKPTPSKRRTMSNDPNKKTVRKLIESLGDKKGRLVKLLELGEMDGVLDSPMTAEAPADEATVDDKVAAAFEEACIAVIRSDMSAAEKIAKLTEILNAQEGIEGGGGSAASESSDESKPASESQSSASGSQPAAGGGGGASSSSGPSPGSATASTPAVQIVDRAPIVIESVTMLQAAGHVVPKQLLEAMVLLPDTAARQALVDSLPPPAASFASVPRSQSPAKPVTVPATEGNSNPTTNTPAGEPKNPGEFIDAIRGVR